jgi:DNA-binding LacI/PurR family transcriptional regulator
VRQPILEMGAMAVNILIKKRGQETTGDAPLILEYELMRRASSGAAQSNSL